MYRVSASHVGPTSDQCHLGELLWDTGDYPYHYYNNVVLFPTWEERKLQKGPRVQRAFCKLFEQWKREARILTHFLGKPFCLHPPRTKTFPGDNRCPCRKQTIMTNIGQLFSGTKGNFAAWIIVVCMYHVCLYFYSSNTKKHALFFHRHTSTIPGEQKEPSALTIQTWELAYFFLTSK